MTTPDRTYSLTIKGEQHTFAVEAWHALSFDVLCAILSDLTGYRESYLTEELPKRFNRLGYATQKVSALQEGEAPSFLIRSNDGGRP